MSLQYLKQKTEKSILAKKGHFTAHDAWSQLRHGHIKENEIVQGLAHSFTVLGEKDNPYHGLNSI